jgi:hypothetical protein
MIFQFQALSFGSFQLGFHRVNWHCPTMSTRSASSLRSMQSYTSSSGPAAPSRTIRLAISRGNSLACAGWLVIQRSTSVSVRTTSSRRPAIASRFTSYESHSEQALEPFITNTRTDSGMTFLERAHIDVGRRRRRRFNVSQVLVPNDPPALARRRGNLARRGALWRRRRPGAYTRPLFSSTYTLLWDALGGFNDKNGSG